MQTADIVEVLTDMNVGHVVDCGNPDYTVLLDNGGITRKVRCGLYCHLIGNLQSECLLPMSCVSQSRNCWLDKFRLTPGSNEYIIGTW
jgi:hypothetical protein